ncbi:MAG: aspartate dehydrogenase domain-containing protein, partial [Candidatus Njordarchaeota archaeon]
GATISIAAKKDIEVEIWAYPEIPQTVHKIIFESDATTCTIEVINKHHPENPRTSYLAPLSLIRTLQKMSEKIIAGT